MNDVKPRSAKAVIVVILIALCVFTIILVFAKGKSSDSDKTEDKIVPAAASDSSVTESVDSAPQETDTDILLRRLADNGVDVENCEYSEKTKCLKLTVRSQAEGTELSPDFVKAKRLALNTLRYEADDLSIISSMAKVNEVVINSSGVVISDSESDIMELPDFPECTSLIRNRAATPKIDKLEASIKEIIAEDVDVKLNVSSSAAGSTLHLTLDYPARDDETINENIALIMREIDIYNQKDPAVHQVELTVNCSDELLVYMYADLVYRDFSWWQTPDMETRWTEF